MAWYNPRDWFKKKYPTPPPTGIVKPSDTEISTPKYVLKETKPTTGDTAPVTPTWTSGGGGGTTTPTPIITETPIQVEPKIDKPAESLMPGEGGITSESVRGTGGLFYLTPKESRRYAGTRPVWEVESSRASDIIREVGWAGGVQVHDEPTKSIIAPMLGSEISRGQYELNRKQIRQLKEGFGKEQTLIGDIVGARKEFMLSPESFSGREGFKETLIPGGTKYELGEDYYKTIPSYKEYLNLFTEKGYLKDSDKQSYLLQAKKDFMTLPKDVRIKSTVGEFILGGQQLGLGIIEGMIGFGMKLGVQTIKTDEKGIIIPPKKFSFGSWSKSIQTTPTVQASKIWYLEPKAWAFEVVRERPALAMKFGVGGAVGYHLGIGFLGSVKAHGIKTGILESIKYFSPLRIKETLFLPNIRKEIALEGKGRTVEFIYGKGKKGISITGVKTKTLGIDLGSAQYSEIVGKNIVGTSVTKIKTPYAEFLGGKLTIKQGVFDSVNLFSGHPSGKGFVTDVITGVKSKFGSGIYKTQTFGYRKNIFDISPKIKTFGYIGGERVSGFYQETPASLSGGYPTYKYFKGFKPSLRGYGISFDFSKSTTPNFINKVFGGSGKGFKTSFGGGMGTQKLYASQTKLKFQPTLGIVSTSNIVSKMGTGIKGLTAGITTTTKTDYKTKFKTKQEVVTIPKTVTITKSKVKTIILPKTWTGIKPSYKFKQDILPVQIPMPKTKLKQPQKTKLKQPGFPMTPPLPLIPIIPTPRFGWKIPIPLILPPFSYFETTKKPQTKKKKFQYTPSVVALALGKTAFKIPKLTFTGIVTRPIIKKKKKSKKRKRKK